MLVKQQMNSGLLCPVPVTCPFLPHPSADFVAEGELTAFYSGVNVCQIMVKPYKA